MPESLMEDLMDVLTSPRVADERERKLTYILNVLTADAPVHEDDEAKRAHVKRMSMHKQTAGRLIAEHRRGAQ